MRKPDITEEQFVEAIMEIRPLRPDYIYVTGPGRSGAIAAAYLSHTHGLAFIPYGQPCPNNRKLLLADTMAKSGKTIRGAMKMYEGATPMLIFGNRPHKLYFWFELLRCKHERKVA